jgi:hypothetical protein
MDNKVTVYEYEGSGVNIKVGVYGTPGIIWIGSSSYCLVSDHLGRYRTRSNQKVSITSVNGNGEIRRIVQPWDQESAELAERFEVTSI